MKTYKEKKNDVRYRAMGFADYISRRHVSWGEIAIYQNSLSKQAKRYGLLTEFHINGVI